jgi:hypothetical protein
MRAVNTGRTSGSSYASASQRNACSSSGKVTAQPYRIGGQRDPLTSQEAQQHLDARARPPLSTGRCRCADTPSALW